MGARMQHPSSGRRNFDMATATTNDQSSTSTQQDSDPIKIIKTKKMGKVRMLHPSSGRDNFDTVSNQATANIGTDQDAGQTVDKKEIEDKTKDAIKAAVAPQSQTPSDSVNKTA